MTNKQTSASVNLGIVVPCFNEEEVLNVTNSRLITLLQEMREEGLINQQSSICYVDDGSHDGNHQVISFMYLEKFLSSSGIYVIEDIQPETIPGMQDLSAFPEDFRAYIREKYDVEIFDTRGITNKRDDFMISFKRKA